MLPGMGQGRHTMPGMARGWGWWYVACRGRGMHTMDVVRRGRHSALSYGRYGIVKFGH